MQGGNRIQGPSTASAGGTIEITLTRGDREVWVDNGAPNSVTRYQAGPNRKVTVSVPNTPGEYLFVTVRHGSDVTTITIPIIAPSP